MSAKIQKTLVNLAELHEDGQSYSFNRTSGELNSSLNDLIKDLPYQVNIELRPAGNIFEVRGDITATMALDCTRCGRDSSFLVKNSFSELIMISPRPRKGTPTSHEGHSNGPFCTYLESPILNLTDFIHEHIAAAEPYVHECERADCEEYLQKIQERLGPIETEKAKPFEVLKKLLKPDGH